MWYHYEFQRWNALGWIRPERYGPKSRKFIEASIKKQSNVRFLSYVSPDCTTPSKVSVKSVAIRAICNRVNDATLDMLKGKIRNRVMFGGQDKFATHLIEAALTNFVHCIGGNMEGKTRNLRRKDKS